MKKLNSNLKGDFCDEELKFFKCGSSDLSVETEVTGEELLQRLKEAAEIYNVTKLTDYLDEVESLGPASKRLAQHLRTPIRNYDMEAILTILSQIRNDQ